MAVERMRLMNVVLSREHLFTFMRDMLLHERIEMVDARKMIDETKFLLTAQTSYTQQIFELNEVEAISVENQNDGALSALKALAERSSVDLVFQEGCCVGSEDFFLKPKGAIEEDQALLEANAALDKVLEDLEALAPYRRVAALGVDFALASYFKMENFEAKLGFIHVDDGRRLRRLAEDLPVLFFDFDREREQELLLFFYPKEMDKESARILQSLQFTPIDFDSRFLDLDLGKDLEATLAQLEEREAQARAALRALGETHHKAFQARYSKLLLEEKMLECLANVGGTAHYAYLSLWTVDHRAEAIKGVVENEFNGQCSVLRSEEAKVYEKAPTSLKNGAFIRPFERLVYMYGTPSYKELDPTTFFGYTYMLLFGIMFGDLGQGLVFFLAGLVLKKKRHPGMGGVLSRLGLASMVAGFFFDSVFGFEGVLSDHIGLNIFFHPFDHSSILLGASVVLGIVLLSCAYVMGIINKLRQEEYEEAFFGREGGAGFLLNSFFVLLVLGIVGIKVLPTVVPVLGLLGSALLLFFREPLYRLILGKRPLHVTKRSDYYVENSFGLLEAFLTVLSNLLSFIRVGAFALNHVGLFLAFHTMAQMLNSSAGTIGMAILGNLVILGLEGLIVFIQDLRLMYYELFSKFFKGEGRPFKPVSLKEVSE